MAANFADDAFRALRPAQTKSVFYRKGAYNLSCSPRGKCYIFPNPADPAQIFAAESVQGIVHPDLGPACAFVQFGSGTPDYRKLASEPFNPLFTCEHNAFCYWLPAEQTQELFSRCAKAFMKFGAEFDSLPPWDRSYPFQLFAIETEPGRCLVHAALSPASRRFLDSLAAELPFLAPRFESRDYFGSYDNFCTDNFTRALGAQAALSCFDAMDIDMRCEILSCSGPSGFGYSPHHGFSEIQRLAAVRAEAKAIDKAASKANASGPKRGI